MPDQSLVLSLVARPDGRVVLRATRTDGSSTWQVHDGVRAGFLPVHDLGHLAVETVLGTRDGFYGLLAGGWDMAETGGKGARGPLPPEAVIVEHLVGLLDREQVGGAPLLSAADVQSHLVALVADGRLAWAPPISADLLAAVRAQRDALISAWAATPAGQPFERRYVRPDHSRWMMP